MIDIQRFATKHRLKTRIDDDLTKIIGGKVGHIYEYDDEHLGVIVIPEPPRPAYWSHTRKTLIAAGFEVVQNGEGEGCAIFDPNNPEQVKLAIKAAKVKRRRVMSEAQLASITKARESLRSGKI